MATRLEYLRALEEAIPETTLRDDDGFKFRTAVPVSLYLESFCDVWSEYNAAIVNNVLGLCRHVRVLSAWDGVLGRFDEDEQRVGVLIDFVEPTLFRARDLPGAIREQCHQCVGKMHYVLESRDETLDEVRSPRHGSTYWRGYHHDHHLECDEYDDLRDRLGSLWEGNGGNARRLAHSHGDRHHDMATIVGTKRHRPMVWEEGGGLGHGYVEDEPSLGDELAIVDEQRERSQEAYFALDAYLGRLFDALIEDLQERGVDVRLL